MSLRILRFPKNFVRRFEKTFHQDNSSRKQLLSLHNGFVLTGLLNIANFGSFRSGSEAYTRMLTNYGFLANRCLNQSLFINNENLIHYRKIFNLRELF